MNQPVIPDSVVAEALGELDQYLSDRVAPLMVSEAMTVLARAPIRRVAKEVERWAAAQRTASALPISDYFFHALRKVQIVGEFRLVPPSLFEPFFTRLQVAVLELTPAAERARLTGELARLGEARSESVDQVERIHRPSGERRGEEAPPPAAPEPHRPAGTEGRLRLSSALALPAALLRRLNLVLDALAGLAPSAAPERREALAAEAFASASAGASSPAEMQAQLDEFRSAGLVEHTYDAFRLLSEKLPGWWAARLPDSDEAGRPLAAMRRMITLTDDAREAARRFREMVESAIEQFNAGALGRSVRMLDLALQMIERGDVSPETVEPLRAKGHQSLDRERLREMLTAKDRQGFPRVLLRFFRAFAPETLLDELAREPGRERRQLLLALMEAHGDEGRRATFDRLVRTPAELHEYYVFRNLVRLLRTIPRSVNTTWEPEHEIARVIRFLVPDSPLFLVKEIADYLTAMQHRVADQALELFVDALEGALAAGDGSARDQAHWRSALDAVCAVLAACPEPSAWGTVVEHGLKRDPRLGSPLARLAELGRQDLAEAPELNARVSGAALAELPVDTGGAPREQMQRLHYWVRALSGTRSAEARAFFEILSMRCPDAEVGRQARGVLRELGASLPGVVAPHGTLSGDLDVFGLPGLVQSLAELRQTGTLTLIDTSGHAAAHLTFENGRIRNASMGELVGDDAFYQMLERPFPGRFSFVSETTPGMLGLPGRSEGGEITPLLLEGLRRQDELRRLETLIAADTVLVPTKGGAPTEVPGEADAELITVLWRTVATGSTAADCEQTVLVDAYRAWAVIGHWVEAGVLRSVEASGT